jgi:membrane protease YdiL (CAAX protease family)
LTARAFFYRPDGRLRVPWQWLGFIVVMVLAMAVISLVAVLVARPESFWEQQTVGFWSLLLAALFAHQVMLRWVDGRPWSYVGLARFQAAPRRLVVGLLVGSLAILIPSGVLLLARWLVAEPAVAGTGEGAMAWGRYAALMAVFFLPQSLGEELMSRGYLFATAREAIGWRGALLLTSVIFGALHLWNPGADVQTTALVTLAGIFLGGILLLTDSLYAAWMAHFAWNWSMAAVLHTAVSGLPFTAPDYKVVDGGPDWATGGSWGPEGGAGAALGMIVGLWLLFEWRRRRTLTANETQRVETWRNDA